MAVPFDLVTPDLLDEADLVHFVDPEDPRYHRYLPVRPVAAWRRSASGRSPCRLLTVTVDRLWAGMQVCDLAYRIRVAAALAETGLDGAPVE